MQTSIVEDITSHMGRCKIFNKMNLKSGYHQFTIDQELMRIATFSTPSANYRPKRLIFGTKSSQDVFDGAMFCISEDIS